MATARTAPVRRRRVAKVREAPGDIDGHLAPVDATGAEEATGATIGPAEAQQVGPVAPGQTEAPPEQAERTLTAEERQLASLGPIERGVLTVVGEGEIADRVKGFATGKLADALAARGITIARGTLNVSLRLLDDNPDSEGRRSGLGFIHRDIKKRRVYSFALTDKGRWALENLPAVEEAAAPTPLQPKATGVRRPGRQMPDGMTPEQVLTWMATELRRLWKLEDKLNAKGGIRKVGRDEAAEKQIAALEKELQGMQADLRRETAANISLQETLLDLEEELKAQRKAPVRSFGPGLKNPLRPKDMARLVQRQAAGGGR